MDIVLPVDGTVVSARTLTVYGEYDANLDKVGVAAFAPPGAFISSSFLAFDMYYSFSLLMCFLLS